jgi:hypothetical protein
MSEYRLDITGEIDLSTYSNIHDYMAIVGENDKVVITVEHANRENIDILCSLLKNDNFNINSEENDINDKTSISASKIK